jgi:hypothetical protein
MQIASKIEVYKGYLNTRHFKKIVSYGQKISLSFSILYEANYSPAAFLKYLM